MLTSIKDYSVVIVGAGAAGVTVAAILRNHRVRMTTSLHGLWLVLANST